MHPLRYRLITEKELKRKWPRENELEGNKLLATSTSPKVKNYISVSVIIHSNIEELMPRRRTENEWIWINL